MTALRFVLLLALALAAACASRDPAPAAADRAPSEPHGQPPGINVHFNGNTQFFGGSTWYH